MKVYGLGSDTGSIGSTRSIESFDRSIGSNKSISSHRSFKTAATSYYKPSSPEELFPMRRIKSDGALINLSNNKRTTAFKPTSITVVNKQQQRQEQPKKRNNKHSKVSFGTVEIREHGVTIGDNPGGFAGVPLTIEWEYQVCSNFSINDYEQNRPQRRTASQMNMPQTIRNEMLRRAGHSRGEIQDATKNVNISRRRRQRTVETMGLTPIHELSESLLRGGANAFFRRGKKKKEREYLQHAMSLNNKKEQVSKQKQHTNNNHQIIKTTGQSKIQQQQYNHNNISKERNNNNRLSGRVNNNTKNRIVNAQQPITTTRTKVVTNSSTTIKNIPKSSSLAMEC